MTLSLRRCAVAVCWLAVGILVATVGLPTGVGAQSPSYKMRAAPPAKTRAPARTVYHPASAWVANPAVNAKGSYLILDAMSGRVLASDRADELRHPASLTKLMTLYLTFSALDSGRLSLGDMLPVSISALNAPPTKMGFTGGKVMVRDAIMGLVTRSANDAAVVLGEALGGDEANFARIMTQKARQLGMTSTVYRNASGLPNSEQVTTAHDVAKLAHALMRDFPHYYPIFSVQSYLYHGRPLENHNRMLATYAGADGLKTGYTASSGFNLVLSAVRDNRRLIGVVMGGDTGFSRDRLMAELMDRGFATAQSLDLSPWTSPRVPSSARYSAANFVPGSIIPDAPRVNLVAKAEPAPVPSAGSPGSIRLAATAPTVPAEGGIPALGSWVIQVGSFTDSHSAEIALERASSALPQSIRAHSSITVDEVQMAKKTFHRARVTNLSEEEAIDGCKRLEKHRIYCSALQVTAWNTPGAH